MRAGCNPGGGIGVPRDNSVSTGSVRVLSRSESSWIWAEKSLSAFTAGSFWSSVSTDTGAGIPEEEREQIFKPFTRVRNLAEGDGLGLPICAFINALGESSVA